MRKEVESMGFYNDEYDDEYGNVDDGEDNDTDDDSDENDDRDGERGKIVIEVRDEDENPVENARVDIETPMLGPGRDLLRLVLPTRVVMLQYLILIMLNLSLSQH